jgi:hypothetical protein
VEKQKTFASITSGILLMIFILALTAPVTAQDDTRFKHTVYYDVGGKIFINREIGHACTTGAVKRQRIEGYGELDKAETISIAGNIITVDETTNWTVPAGAIGGLSVTTTIDLCNRAMSVVAEDYIVDGETILEAGAIINTYHPLVVDGTIKVTAATSQAWATLITTNPGHLGTYDADFIAAYGPGPYEKLYGAEDIYGNIFFYDDDYMWEYREGVSHLDRDDRKKGYERGDYYVGNYFNIDQYAYTSEGSMRRYISMSSPFENTVFEQELNVVGMAEVRESFDLHNLKGGPKAITLVWYELF